MSCCTKRSNVTRFRAALLTLSQHLDSVVFMKRLLAPTVAVSLLTVVTQALAVLTQVVVASTFGAGAEFDAYLAALTLPAYLTSVLLGGLSFVFIPAFITYRSRGDEVLAWRVASNVIVIYGVVLGVMTLLGALASEAVLRLTVPGLPGPTLALSAKLAVILWPTVLLGGLAALLTGLHHAHDRFGWPALTPVAGGAVALCTIAAFGGHGIVVLPLAMLASGLVQCALLLPGIYARFVWPARLFNAEVGSILRLLAPLVVSAFFAQAAQPIERYFSSSLPLGSIAHLGYANRIMSSLGALLSGGLAVTLFPTLSRLSAADDGSALGDSLLFGLRAVWLLAAPVVAFGIAMAAPLVGAILQRGAFGPEDSAAVAALLPWYLLGIIGICGGNIMARGFFALKDTRTVSLLAVTEVALYSAYTPLLSRRFGASGLAAAAALYWNISIIAQGIFLRRRLGTIGLGRLWPSISRITLAAVVAGIASYAAGRLGGPWTAIGLSGVACTLTYVGMLSLLRSPEWTWIVVAGRDRLLGQRQPVGVFPNG